MVTAREARLKNEKSACKCAQDKKRDYSHMEIYLPALCWRMKPQLCTFFMLCLINQYFHTLLMVLWPSWLIRTNLPLNSVKCSAFNDFMIVVWNVFVLICSLLSWSSLAKLKRKCCWNDRKSEKRQRSSKWSFRWVPSLHECVDRIVCELAVGNKPPKVLCLTASLKIFTWSHTSSHKSLNLITNAR